LDGQRRARLEKLAALVPRPYTNLIVKHGVLAPNAKWLREVVAFGRPKAPDERPTSASRKVAVPRNCTWAELTRRGLEIEVLECPDCDGRMVFVAAIIHRARDSRGLQFQGRSLSDD
jgi:hypothetical protein